ncbi:MAG: hypothetical protein IJ228_00405 [Succinivibrio sp.]|nr:hypothetical protein [Succinivibrio sp.]
MSKLTLLAGAVASIIALSGCINYYSCPYPPPAESGAINIGAAPAAAAPAAHPNTPTVSTSEVPAYDGSAPDLSDSGSAAVNETVQENQSLSTKISDALTPSAKSSADGICDEFSANFYKTLVKYKGAGLSVSGQVEPVAGASSNITDIVIRTANTDVRYTDEWNGPSKFAAGQNAAVKGRIENISKQSGGRCLIKLGPI